MKSFFVSLVVSAFAFHEGGAFSAVPPTAPTAHRATRLHAATINPRSDGMRAAAASSSVAKTPPVNKQREMDSIRAELIDKYISQGHSEEYAAEQVAYFLEDPERSAQYVEMRRLAMARGNDLGIEDFVQFAAAFLVGMFGSWALNIFHDMQGSGLPWVS